MNDLNNLTVKELAKKLNISQPDAQSVKDASIQMECSIDDVMKMLEIETLKKTTDRKSRKRSDAPVHRMYAGLKANTPFNKAEVEKEFLDSECIKIFGTDYPTKINQVNDLISEFNKATQGKKGVEKLPVILEFNTKADSVLAGTKINNIAETILKQYKNLRNRVKKVLDVDNKDGNNNSINTNTAYFEKVQIVQVPNESTMLVMVDDNNEDSNLIALANEQRVKSIEYRAKWAKTSEKSKAKSKAKKDAAKITTTEEE